MSKAVKNTSWSLVLMLIPLFGFQNCTSTKFSSSAPAENSKSGSNGGFDGKMYVHQGACGANLADIDTRVQFSSTDGVIHVLRENCIDLSEPFLDRSGEFNTAALPLNVIIGINSKTILDAEATSAATQRITGAVCLPSAPAVGEASASLWSEAAAPSSYFSTVSISEKVAPMIYDSIPVSIVQGRVALSTYSGPAPFTQSPVNVNLSAGAGQLTLNVTLVNTSPTSGVSSPALSSMSCISSVSFYSGVIEGTTTTVSQPHSSLSYAEDSGKQKGAYGKSSPEDN